MLLTFAFLVVAALGLGTSWWWLPRIGHWLEMPSQAAPADSVVVYGGGLRRDRPLHGIALYKQGLAPEYWHTGYVRSRDEVREFVLERGIPPEDFTWVVSHSTWTDGQGVVAQAQKRELDHLLLVTEWWHSRRALCAIQYPLADTAITVSFSAPPIREYGPDNWWLHPEGRYVVITELLKFGYYWLRYGMVPWDC
jgi:uncharacterized SAM-binding protein YcdF (DUF218 family)